MHARRKRTRPVPMQRSSGGRRRVVSRCVTPQPIAHQVHGWSKHQHHFLPVLSSWCRRLPPFVRLFVRSFVRSFVHASIRPPPSRESSVRSCHLWFRVTCVQMRLIVMLQTRPFQVTCPGCDLRIAVRSSYRPAFLARLNTCIHKVVWCLVCVDISSPSLS